MNSKALNLILIAIAGLIFAGCNGGGSSLNSAALSQSVNNGVLSTELSQLKYAQVSEGYGSSCALDTAGNVWCWGDNSLGQVGVGSTAILQYDFPQLVETSIKFSSISNQGQTVCGLTGAGDIWCWGSNSYGQVGSGSNLAQFNHPQAVVAKVKFASLARGVNSACALDQTGAAWCWGNNGLGQIGNGSRWHSVSYNTPQKVATTSKFKSLAVGLSTVCALDESGIPWCWGDNNKHKINSTNLPMYNLPLKLKLPSGVTRFAKIAVGDSMTCGIDQSASMWCWGDNTYGQLGDGSYQSSNGVAQLVQAPGVKFSQLALGIRSVCALDSNSDAWCWGANASYQVGNGKTNYSFNTPQKVATAGIKYNSISVGLYTACASDTAGAAWCWGSNTLGQVGVGNSLTLKYNTPQAVVMVMLDCSAAPGPGVNWQTCDKANAGYNGKNFSDANLRSANFSNTQFAAAYLARASLQGANLGHTNFMGADLSHANLTAANFLDAAAAGEDMTLIDKNTIFIGTILDGLSIRHYDLAGINMLNASLIQSVLSDSAFDQAQLSAANLTAANLSRASFKAANLNDVKLNGANLMASNFQGADLSHANLTGAVFFDGLASEESRTLISSSTIFIGAILDGLRIANYNLAGINMAYASLITANLSQDNFESALLIGANFANANLSQSNFSGANLMEANLAGANLESANFSGAIWIDGRICATPSISDCY